MIKLTKYDAARRALGAAVRVDEVLKIRNAAKQFEAASRVAKDRQMMADAAEIVRRAEFRLAELVKAQRQTVGLAKAGRKPKIGVPRTPIKPTLKDAGIDKNLAKRVRRAESIALRGDAAVEAEIERTRAVAASAIEKPTQTEKIERRAERERELGAKILAFPDKQYGLIYADPPWNFEEYNRETGGDRAAVNHYPTMTVEEIKAVKIPAAKDCVLSLWATAPMLPQALEVMEAWGFHYKSHCVWIKNHVGTGYWFRNQHELLLIGTRGDIPAPAPGSQYASVFTADVGRHSSKPFCFREMLDELFPTLPRIELFARERYAGWDAWGYEAHERHGEQGVLITNLSAL